RNDEGRAWAPLTLASVLAIYGSVATTARIFHAMLVDQTSTPPLELAILGGGLVGLGLCVAIGWLLPPGLFFVSARSASRVAVVVFLGLALILGSRGVYELQTAGMLDASLIGRDWSELRIPGFYPSFQSVAVRALMVGVFVSFWIRARICL